MKKNLQLQFGISVGDKSVDIVVNNEGLHMFYDNLGDVSGKDIPVTSLQR